MLNLISSLHRTNSQRGNTCRKTRRGSCASEANIQQQHPKQTNSGRTENTSQARINGQCSPKLIHPPPNKSFLSLSIVAAKLFICIWTLGRKFPAGRFLSNVKFLVFKRFILKVKRRLRWTGTDWDRSFSVVLEEEAPSGETNKGENTLAGKHQVSMSDYLSSKDMKHRGVMDTAGYHECGGEDDQSWKRGSQVEERTNAVAKCSLLVPLSFSPICFFFTN